MEENSTVHGGYPMLAIPIVMIGIAVVVDKIGPASEGKSWITKFLAALGAGMAAGTLLT